MKWNKQQSWFSGALALHSLLTGSNYIAICHYITLLTRNYSNRQENTLDFASLTYTDSKPEMPTPWHKHKRQGGENKTACSLQCMLARQQRSEIVQQRKIKMEVQRSAKEHNARKQEKGPYRTTSSVERSTEKRDKKKVVQIHTFLKP